MVRLGGIVRRSQVASSPGHAVVCSSFERSAANGSEPGPPNGWAAAFDRAGGDVPAIGADVWFGWLGGAREPPPEPAWQPQFADLLEQVVTSAGRLVDAPDALLYLVEHGGRRLVVRCGAGCFVTSVGSSVGKGQGLAGEVWRTGEPLAVDESQTWPRRLRGDRGADEVCGALAVPVCSHGAVVGVLGVASSEPGRVFGEAEIELQT